MGERYTFHMSVLEVFIHGGCLSEQRARIVAEEVSRTLPGLHVLVCFQQSNLQRISELDLSVFPAFVLNGELLAVGVPRSDWLLREIKKDLQEH